MKKYVFLITLIMILFYGKAQNIVDPNIYQGYYYANGMQQVWEEDSTSVNIIVNGDTTIYNQVIARLLLLFTNPNDQILFDNEDDNIIINSNRLKSLPKDYIVNFITNNNPNIIAFFTYSKLIGQNSIWLRNEVSVKYRQGVSISLSSLESQLVNYDLIEIIQESDNDFIILCKNEYDVVEIANKLYDTNLVVYSTPDFYTDYVLNSNDPMYSLQYYLHNTGQKIPTHLDNLSGTSGMDIKAPEAWAFLNSVLGQPGRNIKIAVIDDGVEPHEDMYLTGGVSKVLDGYTANGDGTGRPRPNHKHGQCCAGLIAATADNGIGIAGVAPNSFIVPIRIKKDNGKYFSNKNIGKAIAKSWTTFGAEILSNSWGTADDNVKSDHVITAFEDAIKYGRNTKGCIVVAASGNDGKTNKLNFICDIEGVISVGGINKHGQRGVYSNCGNNLDIVAFGGDVYSYQGTKYCNIRTIDRGGSYGYSTTSKYWDYFGLTSAACPQVSGVVALMLSANPNLTSHQIWNLIGNTAQKIRANDLYTYSTAPAGTRNNEVGYGLVDAHKAVIAAFMYGRSTTLSGEMYPSACNTYTYTCDIYRPDLFTYTWTTSSNLTITQRDGNLIKVIPTGAGPASITVKVAAQGREIYSVTKSNIVIRGTSSQSLVALTTSTSPIAIRSTVTWSNNNHLLPVAVTVESGGTLNITGHVKCMSNAKITVKPGGKLIVNGGTLTGMCNSSWKGIEVQGMYAQYIQGYRDHGIVELKNGAVIENAEYALFVGSRFSGANQAGYGGGGIVYAKNTTFRNNAMAVEYQPYTHKNLSGTSEMANMGNFVDCDFIIDDDAFLTCSRMVFLREVRDVRFSGCTFKNTSNQAISYGIFLGNASVWMDRVGLQQNGPFSPPTYSDKGNSFSGFSRGIYIYSAPTKTSRINHVDFSNCNTGIFVMSCNEIIIRSCSVDMGSSNSTTGFYLNACNNYSVENNLFEGEGDKIGINVSFGGEDNNYIRYNTFTDLCSPILINGQNGNVANCTGLQVLCNHFKDNGTPIHVRGANAMRPLQGSSSSGAGNIFTNPVVSFYIEGSTNITYYWDSIPLEHYPVNYYPNNLTVRAAGASSCPKGIGYMGELYYLHQPGGPLEPRLASLSNSYTEQKAMLTVKKTLYKQRYNNAKIDLNAFKNENIQNPQVLSYLEIADISQSISSICREAFRIIMEDTVFNRDEFHIWLQRENILSSYYTLAESYVEISDWANAEKILDTIPVLFPDCNQVQHQYYKTCLSLQYQWKDKDRSEVSQQEISILKTILDNETEGIVSAKARGIWDWIHDTITTTCPFPEGICAQRGGSEVILNKGQKSVGNDLIIQDEINNEIISVNIHPNPARNTVFISLDKMPDASVNYQLYDIQGKELQNGNFNNQKLELDISSLSKGLYFISVTVENQSKTTKKLVKE